jgi:hypothetical protein
MSNSAFMGTDEDGLLIPAEKSDEDRKYHLNGELQLALEVMGGAKLLIPR